MLKFESIIRNLTLDEKISFITSDIKYESFKVENYDLPTFEIKKAYDMKGVNESLKISYKSLLSSWGINYANKYFNNIYDSINSYKTIFGIQIKDKDKKYMDGVYPDNYLLGSFAKLELDAISSKGYFSCITDFPRIYYDKFDNNEVAPYLIALSGNPSSVILKTKDSLDFVNKYSGFEGFKLFEATNDSDSIYALNSGAIFVFYDNAKEAILNALDRYEVEKINLDNGTITNQEFENLKEEGLILSSEKLDMVVNEYFQMLLKLDESYKNPALKENDNINVQDVTSDICESVILLKNDGILPVEGSPRIGIIGDFASNFQFYGGSMDFKTAIKKYELNITGYSHGFIEENIDLEMVYQDAERIASESEYVLLFLGKYDSKNFEIPEKEMELLEAIRKYNAKIIAIVNSDDITDYASLEWCDALIQTNILNKYGLNAVIDTIFGISVPSGRTTRFYHINDAKNEVLDKTYQYALGYGLGYGIFDYSNLEVSKKGAIFTVKNSGPIASFEVAQLYISTLDSDEMNFKLCGFKKMFIKANESIKFIIPFDEFSFKVFDSEKKKYVIKKGKYQISVSDESGKIMLSEIIELDDFIYDEYKIKNEVEFEVDIKKAYQNLVKEENEKSYIKNDKAHGKAKKLFIAIMVGIYYNALLGFVLFANLRGESYKAVTISAIALLLVFDILLVIYLIITIGKKKKEGLDINDDISKVIKDMDKFDLVSEVTFEKPIPVVLEEVTSEETIEEVETEPTYEEAIEEEVEKELTYDKSVVEYVDGNNYSDEIDFLSYTDDFVNYALNSGLIVEPRTARSVLGALASSKMIFLKSQGIELTLKFSELLTQYLSDEFNPVNLENMELKESLYWQVGDNDTVHRTKLANDLLLAKKNYKRFYVETFYNVDEKMDYLTPFMDYSIDPNNSVEINLGSNEEEKVLINKNVFFLVIPKDELFLEHIDEKIANSSAILEIFVRKNEIISEEAKINYVLSYTLFEEKIKENREKLFIDEDNWKKLDDVEEDIANIESFSIDNRMTLAFERMASVMLEAGSDITEVIDYAIATRIVPYIKIMNSYKNAMDESNFKSILANHIGDDVIPVSERALKKPL